MDVLSQAIARLLRRLDQVEDRLARLERLQPAAAAAEPPAPPLVPSPPPPPAPEPSIPEPLPLPGLPVDQGSRAEPVMPVVPAFLAGREPIPAPADRQHLETRMGLTWINRIGVVTLMIGVAFFFKYAIDNQWIGETGRVVLGVLAGLATLAAGDVLWHRGQRVFAQGICGLGVSILYLSFYASFGFYHLLPQAAAFGLMVMTTAMAGALALRYGAAAIAALGLLGGYSTPVLLSTGHDAPWTFFGYLFLLDLGAIVIARSRRWRALDAMAFLATALLYMSWFSEWFRPEKQTVAAIAALAFYALFAVPDWSWIFYTSQVLAGLALAGILPQAVPYLALSLALGAAGLVIADRTRRALAAPFSFGTYWVAYALWRFSNGKPEDTGATFLMLTLAFAMYLVWTPFQMLVRRLEVRTGHLTLMALNAVVFFGSSYALLEPHYHAWLGLLAAALAGVHLVLGMEFWKAQSAAGRDTRPVLLALGIALGFLTLAVPIQFTGFRITLSWALEAAALVWIGRRTNERRVVFGALAVYGFVFIRLYVFDASVAEAHHALVVNSRFVTFAVSAVAFWLGAKWLRTMRQAAAAPYIAGHFIMLSACLFELTDWAATVVGIDSRMSVMAIGVSLVMALYAVLLIGIGVAGRSALDRILGLGLMGVVVLKLYLYDVWEASRLFRMAAFVALGVLLLLTSYLYSRFRAAIEAWWRDEEALK